MGQPERKHQSVFLLEKPLRTGARHTAGTDRRKKTRKIFCERCSREKNPERENACYVLAVMLERKRVLKQIKKRSGERWSRLDL